MKQFNYHEKIKLACITAKGLFLTSQIASNRNERNAFFIFKNRN